MWTRPIPVQRITDPCFFVDPVLQRCVMDGIAGASSDLAAAPSADIANGAPTGADATDEIVLTWVDGRDGLNDEHVMVSYSTNQGGQLVGPDDGGAASTGRGYYSAPALSPDGTDLYLGLQRLHYPVPQRHHQSPRPGRGCAARQHRRRGAPTGWTVLHRGAVGDPRASAQNNLQDEFLGDYVYAAAARTYGVAVWNDVGCHGHLHSPSELLPPDRNRKVGRGPVALPQPAWSFSWSFPCHNTAGQERTGWTTPLT